MDINQYTNVPQLYMQLGLEKYNCALWHCHAADATIDLSCTDLSKFLPTTGSWKTANKIFVIGQECRDLKLVNLDSRVHLWDTAGLVNHERVHFNSCWINWTAWANTKVDSMNQLTDPLKKRPKYMFDCLIGNARHNKSFVGNFVINNNLKDKILFSFFARDQKWIQGHDYDNITTTNTSQCDIDYGNKIVPTMASLFVPYLIYNNSWFSIVPETRPYANFISEKTVKPLMSKRLFVIFSGPNHLAALHQLGFKTFDNVIDESYDTVQDHVRRWTMAAEQITHLLSQDPVEVYQKVLPTLQHNQELILKTDWLKLFHQSIVDLAQNR